MKKLLLVGLFIAFASSASAMGSYSDGPSVFEVLVSLVFLILFIILVVKFFHIAANIQALRNHFTPLERSSRISKSELTLSAARTYANQGDVPRAIQIAKKIMEQNPGYSPAHRNAEQFIDEIAPNN